MAPERKKRRKRKARVPGMTAPKKAQKFLKLPEEVRDELVQYLLTKPAGEVMDGILMLKSLEHVEEAPPAEDTEDEEDEEED